MRRLFRKFWYGNSKPSWNTKNIQNTSTVSALDSSGLIKRPESFYQGTVGNNPPVNKPLLNEDYEQLASLLNKNLALTSSKAALTPDDVLQISTNLSKAVDAVTNPLVDDFNLRAAIIFEKKDGKVWIGSRLEYKDIADKDTINPQLDDMYSLASSNTQKLTPRSAASESRSSTSKNLNVNLDLNKAPNQTGNWGKAFQKTSDTDESSEFLIKQSILKNLEKYRKKGSDDRAFFEYLAAAVTNLILLRNLSKDKNYLLTLCFKATKTSNPETIVEILPSSTEVEIPNTGLVADQPNETPTNENKENTK